jgi:hypothetical protein
MAPCYRAAYHTCLFTFVEAFFSAFFVVVLPGHEGGENRNATPGTQVAVNKKDPVIGRVLVVHDEWRPHGDSNPGRHRERVMS